MQKDNWLLILLMLVTSMLDNSDTRAKVARANNINVL